MAHLGKYTRADTGHLFAHYERKKDDEGHYIKFGNKEIDTSRTYLNYNLATKRDMSQYAYLKKRLEDVKCLNRKDVNVMCDWVVTMPQDLRYLHPEKQEEFFKETYKFLANQYGEQNVLSAYVHLDETTPHMHFSFIPVVKDKKKGIDKVSAYQLFNKTTLQKFHPALKEYLERTLKVECNVLNGATENGNRTITELKASQATEKLQKLENSIQDSQEEFKEQLKKKIRLQGEINICQNELIEVNNGINDKREELKICQNELYKVNNSIQANNGTLKALQGEIEDKKKERDFFKAQKERAEKELNDVLEQIAFYKGDKSTALMSDFTLIMADDKHVQLSVIQKQIEELQHKYEQLKKQPPQIKTIEKIVEVKKEVPVEVKKEVNVDYKKDSEMLYKETLILLDAIDQVIKEAESNPELKKKLSDDSFKKLEDSWIQVARGGHNRSL